MRRPSSFWMTALLLLISSAFRPSSLNSRPERNNGNNGDDSNQNGQARQQRTAKRVQLVASCVGIKKVRHGNHRQRKRTQVLRWKTDDQASRYISQINRFST